MPLALGPPILLNVQGDNPAEVRVYFLSLWCDISGILFGLDVMLTFPR